MWALRYQHGKGPIECPNETLIQEIGKYSILYLMWYLFKHLFILVVLERKVFVVVPSVHKVMLNLLLVMDIDALIFIEFVKYA